MKWILVAAVAGVIFSRWYEIYGDSSLAVTFFDVGQGDAAVVRLPGGEHYLIDGGGYQRRGLLTSELARQGMLQLTAVIMTHPDWDHAAGLTEVLEDLKVNSIWFNDDFYGAFPRTPIFSELLRLAEEKKVSLNRVSHLTMEKARGVTFEWLPLHDSAANSKPNNRSLVLRLAYAGCSLLFTGDAEARVESQIRFLDESPVTVLKVGHHGSKTSTTEAFLRRMRPKIAVISSGANNRYGHPHLEVLQRLRQLGADVFRTDFHGYVRLTLTEEGTLKCETAQGKCGSWKCGLTLPDPFAAF